MRKKATWHGEDTDRRSTAFSLITGPASLSWDGWKGQPTDVTLRYMLSQQNNSPMHDALSPRKISRVISHTFTPKVFWREAGKTSHAPLLLKMKSAVRLEARDTQEKSYCERFQNMRATWL